MGVREEVGGAGIALEVEAIDQEAASHPLDGLTLTSHAPTDPALPSLPHCSAQLQSARMAGEAALAGRLLPMLLGRWFHALSIYHQTYHQKYHASGTHIHTDARTHILIHAQHLIHKPS